MHHVSERASDTEANIATFDSFRLALWSFAIPTDSDSVDSTIQTIQPSDSYNSDSNDSVMPIRAIPIRTIRAIRTIPQRQLSRGASSQYRDIYVLYKNISVRCLAAKRCRFLIHSLWQLHFGCV